MSIYKKITKNRSIRDLASNNTDNAFSVAHFLHLRAVEEEMQYIKRLNQKALLEYREQRVEEVFLDNL